ncbi:MAG: transglutaminase-like domain-containing protein [Planctomycetales bacterium]|jgi:transglutaminase-like putative cysteine protease|nr:transglutaminase-like domain-containing protein [Planctomycetales bacterium]
MKTSCFSVILWIAATQLQAAEPVMWDPAQPYSAERSSPVTYDTELVVTVTPPAKTQLLKVWMPIPLNDQGQDVSSSEFTTFPERVQPQFNTEPVFGNRFAYFEFPDPLGAQILRHTFQVTVWELRWNLDPARIQAFVEWPDSFAPYRRSEDQSVVFDARFETLLLDIVPVRHNPLDDFRSVMTFVDRNFTYDHAHASLQASSVHALELRRGHCSDYHGFCAAMGRLLNSPTRITYGINTFPKSSPSHCKLEAFLPPFGWVSFDVSETQKLAQAIHANQDLSNAERKTLIDAANRRLMQGFRDNTWFVQTRGTDYQLIPPARGPVPVVRTIYAEADGQPLSDPDPSNSQEKKFAWMTSHRFVTDHPISYPFKDTHSLKEWANKDQQ